MKRFFALILALLLCVSFVACSTPINETVEKEKTTEKTEEKIKEKDESEAAQKNETKEEVSKDYTPLLYKVTDDDGSIIWLFGSIHLGVEDMFPLPDYVMDAYYEAEALAVECDVVAIESDMSAAADLLKNMTYSDDTEISDHISEETYEKAVEILKDNNSYSPFFDLYKPILWYTFIELFIYENSDLSSDYGIDVNLLELAHDEEKEILEIESVEFQYDMLANFSLELQVILLEEIIEAYYSDEYYLSVEELVDSWCKGDAEGIISSDETDYGALTAQELSLIEEYNNAMITNRNLSMTEFAQNALENDEEIFICVGAAHVMGEGAMVQLLKEKGYTVEIIQG